MNYLKQIIRCILFPGFSLFSKRVPFTIMIPFLNGWHAYTLGRIFPVKEPAIHCLEYFRYFIPKRGGIIFDVGGELGFETKSFSSIVGKNGKVFVFECFPAHINRLKQIAKKRKNIFVVEKACWNSKTKLEFFKGHTPGSNTPVPNALGQNGQELADMGSEKIFVWADRLDSLWKELTGNAEIEFLKMDIEGAEIEALKGAKELLKSTKKIVVAAYHIRDGRPTAKKVAQCLVASGFDVKIDENLHVYGIRN